MGVLFKIRGGGGWEINYLLKISLKKKKKNLLKISPKPNFDNHSNKKENGDLASLL